MGSVNSFRINTREFVCSWILNTPGRILPDAPSRHGAQRARLGFSRSYNDVGAHYITLSLSLCVILDSSCTLHPCLSATKMCHPAALLLSAPTLQYSAVRFESPLHHARTSPTFMPHTLSRDGCMPYDVYIATCEFGDDCFTTACKRGWGSPIVP